MSETRDASTNPNGYLSIREVLDELVIDFDDVTISKIRFLESRGLIHPERTPSGYRKFFPKDVERLKWILRQQKEKFLPLKVIKRRLDLEDGRVPEYPDSPSLFDDELEENSRDRELAAVVSNIRQVARVAAEVRTSGPDSEPHQAIVNDSVSSLREASDASDASQGAPKSFLASVPTRSELTNGLEGPNRDDAGLRHPNHPSQVETSEGTNQGKGTADARPKPVETASKKGSPAEVSAVTTHEPRLKTASSFSDVSFSIDELASATSTTVEVIAELEEFGFLSSKLVGGIPCFDGDDAIVAKTIISLRSYGLEPRHLKSVRHAAERDASLYGQVVAPLLRQRNPESRSKAKNQLEELADSGSKLYEQILRAELRRIGGR